MQCTPCPDGGTASVDGCCTDSAIDAAPDAPFVCDPVAQTGCSGGQACYSDLYNSSGGLASLTYFCTAPGAGTEGTACTESTDCAAGFWCIKGTIHKCTAYCNTAAMCSTTSPSCLYDQNMTYPFGYCACVTSDPPGVGTCP